MYEIILKSCKWTFNNILEKFVGVSQMEGVLYVILKHYEEPKLKYYFW